MESFQHPFFLQNPLPSGNLCPCVFSRESLSWGSSWLFDIKKITFWLRIFFGSDLCPFFWVTFYDSQALPVDEITLACFQPENQMVKCNPRNGKSDSSKLLIPEKDVFLKKNKCPQASTWQSVCSTAGMWYVIWSHLSSSWQICKLLFLKRILHGMLCK